MSINLNVGRFYVHANTVARGPWWTQLTGQATGLFGFAYFYWLPRFRFARYTDPVFTGRWIADVNWLCFLASVSYHPARKVS